MDAVVDDDLEVSLKNLQGVFGSSDTSASVGSEEDVRMLVDMTVFSRLKALLMRSGVVTVDVNASAPRHEQVVQLFWITTLALTDFPRFYGPTVSSRSCCTTAARSRFLGKREPLGR